MAVKIPAALAAKTPKSAAAAAPAPQEAEAPSVFNLVLRSPVKRYMYGDTLYVAGTVYSFDEAGTRHMLSLLSPSNLPVFALYRGTAQDQVATSKTLPSPLPTAEAEVVQPITNPIPAPVAAAAGIDLSDNDDAELAQKLAAVDAGEATPL